MIFTAFLLDVQH